MMYRMDDNVTHLNGSRMEDHFFSITLDVSASIRIMRTLLRLLT